MRGSTEKLCSHSNLLIPLTYQHEVRHPRLLRRTEQGTESVQSLTIGLVCNGIWDIEEI